ncbi:MAG: AbrB/MazE/SpoVT family DNA-binding domain-containing protein [Syntrophomonadaceae bacterium]|nr:AbrB/MazE/SpoVT family DNA-binding domain-containing protein [Syntrophomonadaceae bacterium]
MPSLKIRKIGNSLGVILPAEIIERLNLKENDQLHLVEEKDRLYLSQYDPEFAEWAEAYRNTKKKYKNSLRELSR